MKNLHQIAVIIIDNNCYLPYFIPMSKSQFTYTIEEAVEKELHDASKKLYRSKSSIVQEAIMKWIDENKNQNDRLHAGVRRSQ